MAQLFQATGGTTSLLPTTSWAAPNALFPTADRNDSSAYSWASASSTLTLPSSGLADGYVFLWGFEFEDASNGRHNPNGRMIQASGTGTFASAQTAGYNRDNSEDRAYVSGWSFVDGPSASATFQFQWKRDTDTPTGGTVRSFIQAIPLYYSDVGVYTSSTAGAYGGITPNLMTGFAGTDGTNITITSNQVSVTGDNKRYLVLGGAYQEGISAGTRTQRWYGLEIDGAFDDAAKACMYYRNAANDNGGSQFIRLIETATATRTIEMNCYRGDGVTAGLGGADVDGSGGSPTNAAHALVVIELNDSAEVYSSVDSVGGQEFALTGPVDVDIASTGDIEFNDAASFTRVSDTAVNAEQAMDVFAFANVSHAREASSIGSGSRWTVHGEFTINGTEQTGVGFHGNYNRGNQSSADCHGSSTNQAGFFAVSSGDDLGVSNQELAGSEGGGGDIETQAGWVGFGLINLDTLEAGGTPRTVTGTTEALTLTENAATANRERIASGSTEALTLTENAATVNPERGVAGVTEALTLTETAATITRALGYRVMASAGSIQIIRRAARKARRRFRAAFNPAILPSAANHRTVSGSTEALTLTENAGTIARDRGVVGATEGLTLTENAATANRERGLAGATEALTLTENTGAVARDRGVGASTEVLVLTTYTAPVSGDRGVVGITEALTLTENAATVNRELGITCSTEALTLTESAATVFTGANREVTGTTEALTLTENAATVNRELPVTGTTEALTLTENAGTIARDRGVGGSTEVLVLTTYTAPVSGDRNVVGTTEALTLTENAATINRERIVSGATEALTLTESQAIVTAGVNRVVTGQTEALELVETAATVEASRGVTGTTEALTLTESAATVDKVLVFDRVVTCTTETLVLTVSSATVTGPVVEPPSTGVGGQIQRGTSTRSARRDITYQIALREDRELVGLITEILKRVA